MRTFLDYDASTCRVKTIQEEWDHHGSYQWTYFVEEIKQHIDFFLQQRLAGKNLDIGGGWYLSYPDSDVVDISPVCLDYNIAPPERKHLFDLDDVAEGKKLPLEDRSFDSATLVSSWQYLSHPWKVVSELERVLKPGAEIYIINGEGAGLTGCIVNHTHSKDIAKAFYEKGYDTLIEDIPDSEGRVDGHGCFRSVCVALPNSENGKRISSIKNRERRLEEVAKFNPNDFMREFSKAEIKTETEKLMQLNQYPITKYSIDLSSKIGDFSKDYFEGTGNVPVFFSDEFSRLGFDMALPDKEPHITATVLYKEDGKHDTDLQEKAKEYGLRFSHHVNYFGDKNLEEFKKNMNKIAKKESLHDDHKTNNIIRKYIEFLAVQKLNSQAQEIEADITSALNSSGIKFNGRVEKEIAFGFHTEASQYRQRRRIDKMIERKNSILHSPELIADTGQLDMKRYIPYFRKFILDRNGNAEPQLSFLDF